jgi:hypothetical protein
MMITCFFPLGMVLVSSVEGNAAAKLQVGDMICYLGTEPKMVRVEGLDFDQTMGALSSYVGQCGTEE